MRIAREIATPACRSRVAGALAGCASVPPQHVDTDIASKRTFTFLMILFSLAETGQTTAAPVVTVPSR